MKIAVITCSNRSAAGERIDESGSILEAGLVEAGHEVASRVVVADEITRIRNAVEAAIETGVQVVITTGGTGLSPTDVTPEAIAPMLDRTIPGIAEALRMVSRHRVPTSVLSRGVAGTIRSVLVVTLPGSPGGVRDGLAVLLPIIDHTVDQIAAGDHRPGGGI